MSNDSIPITKRLGDEPMSYTPYVINPATGKRDWNVPSTKIKVGISHSIEDASDPNVITDVVPNAELKEGQPRYSTSNVEYLGTGVSDKGKAR